MKLYYIIYQFTMHKFFNLNKVSNIINIIDSISNIESKENNTVFNRDKTVFLLLDCSGSISSQRYAYNTIVRKILSNYNKNNRLILILWGINIAIEETTIKKFTKNILQYIEYSGNEDITSAISALLHIWGLNSSETINAIVDKEKYNKFIFEGNNREDYENNILSIFYKSVISNQSQDGDIIVITDGRLMDLKYKNMINECIKHNNLNLNLIIHTVEKVHSFSNDNIYHSRLDNVIHQLEEHTKEVITNTWKKESNNIKINSVTNFDRSVNVINITTIEFKGVKYDFIKEDDVNTLIYTYLKMINTYDEVEMYQTIILTLNATNPYKITWIDDDEKKMLFENNRNKFIRTINNILLSPLVESKKHDFAIKSRKELFEEREKEIQNALSLNKSININNGTALYIDNKVLYINDTNPVISNDDFNCVSHFGFPIYDNHGTDQQLRLQSRLAFSYVFNCDCCSNAIIYIALMINSILQSSENLDMDIKNRFKKIVSALLNKPERDYKTEFKNKFNKEPIPESTVNLINDRFRLNLSGKLMKEIMIDYLMGYDKITLPYNFNISYDKYTSNQVDCITGEFFTSNDIIYKLKHNNKSTIKCGSNNEHIYNINTLKQLEEFNGNLICPFCRESDVDLEKTTMAVNVIKPIDIMKKKPYKPLVGDGKELIRTKDLREYLTTEYYDFSNITDSNIYKPSIMRTNTYFTANDIQLKLFDTFPSLKYILKRLLENNYTFMIYGSSIIRAQGGNDHRSNDVDIIFFNLDTNEKYHELIKLLKSLMKEFINCPDVIVYDSVNNLKCVTLMSSLMKDDDIIKLTLDIPIFIIDKLPDSISNHGIPTLFMVYDNDDPILCLNRETLHSLQTTSVTGFRGEIRYYKHRTKNFNDLGFIRVENKEEFDILNNEMNNVRITVKDDNKMESMSNRNVMPYGDKRNGCKYSTNMIFNPLNYNEFVM